MENNQSGLRWLAIIGLGLTLVWFVRSRLQKRRRKTKLEQARDTAARVLASAQDEASRLNLRSIDTEQILLGLLRDPDGRAAKVLADAGVKVSDIGDVIGRMLGAAVEVKEMDVTPRARQMLKRAQKEAKRRKQDEVEPEHLLLAILGDKNSMAADALKGVGVSAKALRQAVAERLQNAEEKLAQEK